MKINLLYSLGLAIIVVAWFSTFISWFSTITPLKPQVISPVISNGNYNEITSGAVIVKSGCNFDLVNDMPLGVDVTVISKDSILHLKGWALDLVNARIPQIVTILFSGTSGSQVLAPAITGFNRRDVIEYYSLMDSLIASGFQLHLDVKEVPEDEYSLALMMEFENITYLCNKGKKKIRVN